MKQFRNILARISMVPVIAAGALAAVPVSAAEPADGNVTVACVHDNVRIRAEKSGNAATVAVLPENSLCRVYTKEGEDDTTWAHVKSGAYEGYVFTGCLDYSEKTLGDITYTNGVVFLKDTEVYTDPDDSSDVLVERKTGATEEIVPIGSDITYNGYYQVLVSLSTSTIRAGWVKAEDVVTDMIYPDAVSYDDFMAQLKMTKKELQEAQKKAQEAAKKVSSGTSSGSVSDSIIENAGKARSDVTAMLESSVYSTGSSQSAETEETGTSSDQNSTGSSSSGTWTGSVLTAFKGVNYGPSGKETYYNLPMNGVVNIMRGLGNTDKYWVRSDGCKMLGKYIMVAADLKKHPRGSIIQTSLGEAIVADTGTFTTNGSGVSVDIATAW